MEWNMSKKIPAAQFVKEGVPAPDLREGPAGSVYVDNIAVVGLAESAVHK